MLFCALQEIKMGKASILVSALIIIITSTCSNPLNEDDSPELAVTPTSFNFTNTDNQDTLKIYNVGKKELSWEISQKPTWLAVSKSSGNIQQRNKK